MQFGSLQQQSLHFYWIPEVVFPKILHMCHYLAFNIARRCSLATSLAPKTHEIVILTYYDLFPHCVAGVQLLTIITLLYN